MPVCRPAPYLEGLAILMPMLAFVIASVLLLNEKPQAPNWMQALGLEWTFRLAQEPKRLWRRYARYNPLFVWSFVRQLLREALR